MVPRCIIDLIVMKIKYTVATKGLHAYVTKFVCFSWTLSWESYIPRILRDNSYYRRNQDSQTLLYNASFRRGNFSTETEKLSNQSIWRHYLPYLYIYIICLEVGICPML